MFTTRHAQIMFKVASPQTIRNWTREFEAHLSPRATPGSGNVRQFTVEDMQVLALISQMSSESKPFAEIQAALATGQRGERPTVSPDEMETLVAGEVERQLSVQLHETRELAERLQADLDTMQQQFGPLRDENIRLKAQIEDREERIAELKQQVENAQQRVTQLAEEKGESYVKGLMDALTKRGDLSGDGRAGE